MSIGTSTDAAAQVLARADQVSVFSQARKISAMLQACAMQPRGRYGGSASKISLMPVPPVEPQLEAAGYDNPAELYQGQP
jgi:hypothetical protein